MTRRLVVLPPQEELTDAWARAVADAAPALTVTVTAGRADALAALRDAEAAYGTLDPELLAAAPGLRWLQAPMAAPAAGYFFDELVAHPLEVTNFRGIYNDHVAIHAVAMLLALARGLPRYARQQHDAQWLRHLADTDVLHLPASTVLVVGVGGIGAEVGRMLHAIGARVVGVDPRRAEPPEGFASMHAPAELDGLLGSADAVVLTLPHTPQSEGMFDAARLALLPRHCLFVNVGRGATVVLDAVVDALRGAALGGVALDVFDQEPLPPEHPLWAESRALLTPHVAVVGPHVDDRRLGVFRENAVRFAAGRSLINVVDKALWY